MVVANRFVGCAQWPLQKNLNLERFFMRLLLGWIINALCVLALPYVLNAVKVESFAAAIGAALVLGLLNTIIRPILVVLTLPVTVLTVGLFILVINGLTFWLAAYFIPGFSVASFGWAIVAALVYSVISTLVSWLVLRKSD
jgi:putative membrane protein